MANAQIDLSKLLSQAKSDYEESLNNRSNDDYFRVVYPGENGKLVLKLLYNMQSQFVQRKIIRHGKMPCMQMYGENCPICDAIENVVNIKGKETGVQRKYGYKVRGICYAQVMKHDPVYFRGDNDPKIKDVILFMYPITIYKGITKIFMDAGEHLADLVSKNEGLVVEVERTQKNGGFPEYSVYVHPYGKMKSFEDVDGKSGDDLFMDMLSELPNINTAIISNYPTEEIREGVRALAETINQEYLNSNAVNPNSGNENKANTSKHETNQTANTLTDIVNNQKEEQPSSPIQNETTGQEGSKYPDCFGKHQDGDKKCLICSYEADCFIQSDTV